MTESDKKTLQQSLREAWLNALGVFNTAEGEIARATHRVLESLGLGGEAGGGGEGAGGDAESRSAVGELLARVRRNRDVLERRVDEAVKAAITRLRTPIDDQLSSLRGRVERLQRRVDAVTRRRRSG